MGIFDNPMFWSSPAAQTGKLLLDGSLRYMLLDKTYMMLPLLRNTDTTFTNFLLTDASAKRCKVSVNANFYDISYWGGAWVLAGKPDAPRSTEIQGQVVRGGQVVAGDSRPQSFWFGQKRQSTGDAWGWTFAAGAGDPPTGGMLAALGGAGPMIIGALEYGVDNKYKAGAPRGVDEPRVGQPPATAAPYLIQRNNDTFRSVDGRARDTGKTILAYCAQKRTVLVAVQPDQQGPGQTHSDLAFALTQRGFDSAVFLDGSDSATMVVDGGIVVTPGARKNDSIRVGVGFYN